MAESNDYLLVKADVLPEVFVKVMEAKRLLNSGKAVSVNEAVKLAKKYGTENSGSYINGVLSSFEKSL